MQNPIYKMTLREIAKQARAEIREDFARKKANKNR